MNPTVTYTTPDGVARPVRFTFGAMKRIVDRLGCQLSEAFRKYGDSSLPDILYCCMYDREGKPPAGLDPVLFCEDTDPTQNVRMIEALEAACSPGEIKNGLRAILEVAMEVNSISKPAGVLPLPASESPTPTSGTLPSENSTFSATAGLTNGKTNDFTQD